MQQAEAFDKVAAMLQLGFPGGPAVSELASRGNRKAFNFPRSLLKADNFDFSFQRTKNRSTVRHRRPGASGFFQKSKFNHKSKLTYVRHLKLRQLTCSFRRAA